MLLFNIKSQPAGRPLVLVALMATVSQRGCLPFQTVLSAGLVRAPLEKKDIHTEDATSTLGYSKNGAIYGFQSP